MTTQKLTSKSYLAVEFAYGDPTAFSYVRLTNWASNVTVGGNTYNTNMALAVDLPTDKGVMFEGSATVSVQINAAALFGNLVSGEPHSPVFVTIYEVRKTLDDVSEQVFTLYKGKVSHAIKNFRGRRNLVGLRVVSQRVRLDVPLGLPCNVQCTWTFTGPGCEISSVGLAQTGTMDAIDRFTAVIRGLTQPAFFVGADNTRYWRRGYVEKDGLRILITDWSSDIPTSFELSRRPPASWENQSVSVFPGCDKTIAVCRAQWDNEEHFGGFGIEMPAYKPTFENQGT